MLTLTLIATLALTIATAASARRWPRPPAWWMADAYCVHVHESRDWHISNPPYANGFQFMLGTWESVGGSAASWRWASPAEQFYRAYLVWLRDGRSWREWPNTSRACGLR